MIAYPAYHGLGEYEPCVVLFENREEFDEMIQGTDDLELNKAQIWWAGKEFVDGKTLGDYCGKNEKCKIIVKMQHKGAGAPQREPVVDTETHKKMLSFYHKKQEEMKTMEQDEDDAFLHSSWANPNALKGQLHGQGDVKWR